MLHQIYSLTSFVQGGFLCHFHLLLLCLTAAILHSTLVLRKDLPQWSCPITVKFPPGWCWKTYTTAKENPSLSQTSIILGNSWCCTCVCDKAIQPWVVQELVPEAVTLVNRVSSRASAFGAYIFCVLKQSNHYLSENKSQFFFRWVTSPSPQL